MADTALQNAVAAHGAGRLTEAEVGYRRTLRKRPTDPTALYGLGLLEFHRGAVRTGIEYVVRSLEYSPNNGRAWNTLGSMHRSANEPVDAKRAYSRATEAAPDMSEAWYNLGICFRDEGNIDGAVERLRKATKCAAPLAQAHDALASLLYQQGQTLEAAKAFRDWSLSEPENPKARHMAAATSGQNVPPRASDGYVKTHFDEAADTFDSNLKKLGYRAPETVASALLRSTMTNAGIASPSATAPPTARNHTAASEAAANTGSEHTPRPLDSVLDAGCGTGLCGPLIRSLCTRMVGIDLSPRMLGHAKARGCYDQLIIAEIVAFMRSRPEPFDAIVCIDTLVYFGALHEPLGAAHATLRGAGVLIFTVEALAANEPSDHQLQPSGRYAHGEAYLRRALAAAGFELETISSEILREERAQSVAGYLVVARRHMSN